MPLWACKTTTMVNNQAISKSDMDTTVSPGDNFYQYANGGWLINNPLTEEYSRFGSFDKLQEENNEQVKSIIEKLVSGKNNSYTDQLVGKFYAQGMDSATIELQQAEALQSYFETIDKIASYNDFETVLSSFHEMGISPFFSCSSTPDKKNSDWVITGIWQGSLGMNDRDYYLKTDSRTKEIQTAYKKYVATLFNLIGYSEGKTTSLAESIFEFEKELAESSMSRLEMRDPQLTYNKMTLKELSELSSVINWNAYFDSMHIETNDEITIGQTKYMEFLGEFIKKTDLNLLKDYLKFYLTSTSASYLSNEFVDTQFEFYGKVMQGKEQNKPRWKRITSYTNSAVGEALGQAYVKEYFPPESKARMEQLVSNLIAAFGERINNLEWMTDTTKAEAIEKLGKINVKIGYPDKWRDYTNLKFDSKYFLLNVMEARTNNKAYQLAKIGKEVDPDEWLMLPHTVNAYYHPVYNEIVFPAAILQPPFFFPDADDAVNYGAIGVGIARIPIPTISAI